MQDLFRSRNLFEHIENKTFVEIVLKERHANPAKSGQPFCTYSQLLSYENLSGVEIIRAHQYRKPDGKIGASGKPDPFRIFDEKENVIYKLLKSDRT